MKVAIVGPYPAPGETISGGVERVIDTLIRELPRYAQVTLVVPNAAEDMQTEVAGIPMIRLKRTPGPGVLTYWTVDAARVAKVIEDLSPDLVHYQGVAGAARKISRPGILTIHGIAHHDIMFRPATTLMRRILRRASAKLIKTVEQHYRQKIGNLIVINPYVETMLPDLERLVPFTIPNPLDRIYVDTPQNTEARPRHIISAGRIGPRKRTAHAVEISARLLSDDLQAQATFYGTPERAADLEECREIAAAHGVLDRMHFPGNIRADMLCQKLDQASVFLMTSQQETAPVAIAEAHARGVAVVAPKAFGIPHMIDSGENGFFLEDGSIEHQAKLLSRALDHAWNRQEMACRAREVYSPETIAEQTFKSYQAILQSA